MLIRQITTCMSKETFIAIVVSSLTLCGCHDRKISHTPTGMVNDVICPYTPVKDQGTSDACWVYAMLATIESEHIIRGDSVNLSPYYAIYTSMMEQATETYLSQGGTAVSMKGTIDMLPRQIDTMGIMPYDSYHGTANIKVVERKLTSLARQCAKRRTGLARMRRMADELLQRELAPVPPHVYMFGVEYTPQEFAHSVCMPDEYVAMTSYTHHPFNEWISLELPDNKGNGRYMNVSVDTLMNIIVNTLRSGHPVCWEGDITEPGFSFGKGTATLGEDDEENLTQQHRQNEFERFNTTDDHCMELIGLAHDSEGCQYVICKNSWGTANKYGGLMYMSLPYLKMKTIVIMLNVQNLKGVMDI